MGSLRSATDDGEDGSATRELKVVAIPGSLRKNSANRGLLRAAVEICSTDFPDFRIEIVEVSELPFVNPDLEVENRVPDSVTEFRRKVKAADAVLFACPEYNYSLPAVLKNAIDWASRPPSVWGDKTAAIVSASGGSGGKRAQYHLRQVGVFLDLHFINKPELFINVHESGKFDDAGNLIDAALKQRLRLLLSSLRAFTLRLLPNKAST